MHTALKLGFFQTIVDYRLTEVYYYSTQWILRCVNSAVAKYPIVQTTQKGFESIVKFYFTIFTFIENQNCSFSYSC